jgi:hypothetical protein
MQKIASERARVRRMWTMMQRLRWCFQKRTFQESAEMALGTIKDAPVTLGCPHRRPMLHKRGTRDGSQAERVSGARVSAKVNAK